MPAPPDPPSHWEYLVKSHSRLDQPLELPLSETSAQSSFLICAHNSAAIRAVLIGLASHASVASTRLLEQVGVRLSELLAACVEHAPPIGRHRPLRPLDERRQRRFGIGGHRDVHFRIALEVLVVAL
jgi:hypothetical protein